MPLTDILPTLPPDPSPGPTRLIRMLEVERRTALKKSALYDLIKQKKFPRQVKILGQIAFVEAEVEAWIQARIRERDHAEIREDPRRRASASKGLPP